MNLKACPFCGGTNTSARENRHWTGQRFQVLSVSLDHWCERTEGQPQSQLHVKGKTLEDAVEIWNQRVER